LGILWNLPELLVTAFALANNKLNHQAPAEWFLKGTIYVGSVAFCVDFVGSLVAAMVACHEQGVLKSFGVLLNFSASRLIWARREIGGGRGLFCSVRHFRVFQS